MDEKKLPSLAELEAEYFRTHPEVLQAREAARRRARYLAAFGFFAIVAAIVAAWLRGLS